MSNIIQEHFEGTIAQDFARLMIAERLGSGIGREVFVCELDRSLVVKIETRAASFQNIREWEFWQDHREIAQVRKWLAPCVHISPCGTVMTQVRTMPLRRRELPKKMPGFLTDLKPRNYGLIGKRVVCHDYALSLTRLDTKMRKVRWREDD